MGSLVFVTRFQFIAVETRMMKRFFILTWIICFLFDFSESAISLRLAAVHPDHPGKCSILDEDTFLSPGEVWTSGECEQIRCIQSHQNPDKLWLQMASCGVVSFEGPCKLHQDLTLTYPDCCPRYSCSEEATEIL
ncbi:U-scoloptoxin(16)-Ssd1a-like [Artemia franciscana]|uniref:Single domain-containing protein n=1 Tax=Artemia franciscana TaxID=6661 RepID=A0AA88H1J0_ARTSF|nr:hypothetical protein QYM36_019167 [Artemia franciscana]